MPKHSDRKGDDDVHAIWPLFVNRISVGDAITHPNEPLPCMPEGGCEAMCVERPAV
jgi:hypothetical protein